MVKVFAVFALLFLLSGCSFLSFGTKKDAVHDDTEMRVQTYRDELRNSYDEFLREGKSILKQ